MGQPKLHTSPTLALTSHGFQWHHMPRILYPCRVKGRNAAWSPCLATGVARLLLGALTGSHAPLPLGRNTPSERAWRFKYPILVSSPEVSAEGAVLRREGNGPPPRTRPVSAWGQHRLLRAPRVHVLRRLARPRSVTTPRVMTLAPAARGRATPPRWCPLGVSRARFPTWLRRLGGLAHSAGFRSRAGAIRVRSNALRSSAFTAPQP